MYDLIGDDYMPSKTKLGDLLKRYRTNCMLTQQQVADALNINRTTYTYYETGKTEPSIETLHKLVQIFNITYEDLLPSVDDNYVKDSFISSRTNQAIYNLSKDEQQILISRRALSPEKQKELDEFIANLK